MATTKTIQPTNTTITMPGYTDNADVAVLSTDLSNITDAVNSLNSNIGKIQRGQVTGITLVQGQTEVTVTLPESYGSGNAYIAVANLCFYGGAATFSAVLIREQYSSTFVCRIYNSHTTDIQNVKLNWITMSI